MRSSAPSSRAAAAGVGGSPLPSPRSGAGGAAHTATVTGTHSRAPSSSTPSNPIQSVAIVGGTGLLGHAIVNGFIQQQHLFPQGIHVYTIEHFAEDKVSKFSSDFPNVKLHHSVTLDNPQKMDATLSATPVDAIIVAMGGESSVSDLMQGQLNLLQVALKHKVKLFVPNEYGFATNQLHTLNQLATENQSYDCPLLELKAQVAAAVKKSGIGYTFVYAGHVAESWLSPAYG